MIVRSHQRTTPAAKKKSVRRDERNRQSPDFSGSVRPKRPAHRNITPLPLACLPHG
jgi:hypothetical protein